MTLEILEGKTLELFKPVPINVDVKYYIFIHL